MTKQVRLQIINLAQSIFNDVEFKRVILYLNHNKLNDLRLFIDEKLELLEALNTFNGDEVILEQINFCDELENIVMNSYLETLV